MPYGMPHFRADPLSMKADTLQLALHPDADNEWIAGILYAQAVTRALHRLPATQRPDIHLLIKRRADGPYYTNLRASVTSTSVYESSRKLNLYKTIRTWAQTLIQGEPKKKTLQWCLKKRHADLLFPARTSLGKHFPIPWIGWIPDFQHKHLPELFSPEDIQERDRQYQQLIDDATHIVVSSQDAYQDLLQFYRADPEQVSVYHFRTHADPSWFTGDPIETAEKYGLPDKFLMFPSQFWQHKNHLTLLKAIAHIKERGHSDICLVLTGKDSDYRNPQHPEQLKRFIHENDLANNIRYIGFLPRQEQIHLMRGACAIVQPSLFEGWSMLVEDSRTLGKAIFLSDLAVHKEQAYNKARYFDRHSADELARLLEVDWPTLQPGPNLAAESEARLENEMLTAQSGEVLAQIFNKSL